MSLNPLDAPDTPLDADPTSPDEWASLVEATNEVDGPDVVWLALALIAGPRLASRCFADDRDAPATHLAWAELWGRMADAGLPVPSPDGVRTLTTRARAMAAWARRAEVQLVGWSSAAYPPRLRRLPQPPPLLWVEGRLDLDAPTVAIVGARAASPAAMTMARTLARDLAAAGLTVVSGLALGVDGAAHEGALETGHTVAVLGTGIDVCYPSRHRSLARRLARNGTLLTELPPGTPPLAHHFPMRNRLVAGLSVGVVVVEAAETSGALITAHAALEQGKEVMVVPGLALAGRNRGGHALIKDGAALVESSQDVLDVLRAGPLRGWVGRSSQPVDPGTSRVAAAPELAQLFSTWRSGEELELDEIAQLSGVPADRLLAALLECELTGTVGRAPSGRFVRL